MKIVFFGGGGLRTLPLVRSMLACVPGMQDGHIYLYDINAQRIETMGQMIRKSPEFAACDCTVAWGTNLDEALPGADLVYASFRAGSGSSWSLSSLASQRHGFIASDQIAPSGAFLSLMGGGIVLDCARAMEKHCPDAWLCIRANPVPVLSAVVNNHTNIRALGICDGFTNHMWDLSRLMGRDELDLGYDVDVAGVNHASFILRGSYHGEDLFTVLERYIGPNWKPPKWGHKGYTIDVRELALRKMIELYERFGVTSFSNEFDGIAHFWYEEALEFEAKARQDHPKPDTKQPTPTQRSQQHQSNGDREFEELARSEVSEEYWQNQERLDHQLPVRIAQALGGAGRQKIVSSHPSGGRVAGFKERTVLEYSQYLSPEGLELVPDLHVPDAFHGLISSLATHQTLLGDAIATEDPRVLYHALYAYPVKHNSQHLRQLWRELLEINKDEISPAFQATKRYF